MAELKTLQDFYDPTKTGLAAMNILQGQQHLALQQQQVQQQGKNLEIDNLRQAALTAIQENPMAAPMLYNKYMESVGGEQIKDPAAFIANTKPFYDQLKYAPGSTEHQAATGAINQMGVSTQKRSKEEFERELLLEGNTQLSVVSGGSSDPAAAFALSKSEQGQRAAYGREFDPAKQAQLELNKQHMDQVAGIKSELGPLITLGLKASTSLEDLAPLTAQIGPIQANYEKEVKTLGITKAAGLRKDRILTNPDLAQYMDRAKASIPNLEAEITEVKNLRMKTLEQAQQIAAGTRPRTENDNLHVMVGETKAQALHLQYAQAQLALAKDPLNPAKHTAVQQIAQQMDARIQALHEEQTSLDVRRDAQQETARQHQAAEARTGAIGKAQTAWMEETGGNLKTAYKYARQFGVKVEEVTKAAEDPNRTTSSVNVNTFTPASVEAQRDYMKGARTTYDQLKQAQPLLDNIEKAKALIPAAKGFMGTGGETLLEAAKFLNNRVGLSIGTQGIKSAEELRSRIFFNIMDNLKKMDAQPSQQQQQVMQDSLGKLGTDPNALANILDAYGDVVRGKVEQYNEDVAGAEQRGTKFPYDPKIRLRGAAARAVTEPPDTSTMTPGVPSFHDPEKQQRYEKWKQEHTP